MNEKISAEEIRELLQYIEKIKDFERKYKIQITAVERITWGLLLVTAGILDFVFAGYLMGYGPVFIPWALIIPVGLLMTNFLTKRTQIVEEKKEKTPFYKVPINIALVLVIIVVIAFSRESLYFLVMPSIAIILGGAILIDNIFFQQIKYQNKQKIFNYLTPILTILTAVVNILGYFFITSINLELISIEYNNFTLFHGVIFGFTFGIMMIIEAYLTKRMISREK